MVNDTGTATDCTVCRSPDTVETATPGDYEYGVAIAEKFRLRACRRCGSEFVWPRPSLEELAAMYPDTYYAYDQDMSPFWAWLYRIRCRKEAQRLNALSDKRPIRLFDIGTGDCRHFRNIGEEGEYRFSGVELNAKMAADACAQGYDVFAGSFEDFDTAGREGTVDILNMNHVIEHVIDPLETMQKIHTLLDDNGVFYGRTPQIPSNGVKLFGRYWGGYHYPRHLHLFTKESLAAVLKEAGFSHVEVVEDFNLFPALSLQNFLLGKLRLPLATHGGHTKIWTLIVALSTPLVLFDTLFGRGDCMRFVARK